MIEMTFDLHTHSNFSDGKNEIEENIISAVKKGLTKIGVTDHAYRHTAYGVKRRFTDEYLKRAHDLKRAYKKDIEVLVGMEFDLLDLAGNIDMPKGYEDAIDLRLLGVHKATQYSDLISFGYLMSAQFSQRLRSSPKVLETNTNAFIAAIERHDIDVLAHPNYFVKLDMGRIASACEKQGAWLEINARHQDLKKSDVQAILATDAKFVLGSDAHSDKQVGRHGYIEAFMEEFGVDISRIVNAKQV